MLDGDDRAILDRDERRALGAGLARLPSLQVARKHDPRIAAHLLAPVDVAEGPVVVAPPAQRFDLRRRVRLVALAPVEAGVEETDVEAIAERVGEARGE